MGRPETHSFSTQASLVSTASKETIHVTFPARVFFRTTCHCRCARHLSGPEQRARLWRRCGKRQGSVRLLYGRWLRPPSVLLGVIQGRESELARRRQLLYR